MVNPSDHVETPAQDSPPHLMGNSIFGVPKLELSEELSAVSKPLHEDLWVTVRYSQAPL